MTSIPILKKGEKPSKKYIDALEIAIKSDGCTGVLEVYHSCCVLHDLGYRFHIDCHGNSVSRGKIDANFRCCMQDNSKLKWFNPMSWWRYAGVRLFGTFIYPDIQQTFSTYYFNQEGDK